MWDADREDHAHTEQGVESVLNVLQRGVSLIKDLEEKYSGWNILLVSHGDTLQILQTAFDNTRPSRHRDLKNLETAEIRPMTDSVTRAVI